MSPNIPENVAKNSRECCQRSQGMLPNILGNVAKHSREYRQTFRGMSPNIPGNVIKHFEECHQTFQECPQTFWGMLPNIPENVLKHSRKCLLLKEMKMQGQFKFHLVFVFGPPQMFDWIPNATLIGGAVNAGWR